MWALIVFSVITNVVAQSEIQTIPVSKLELGTIIDPNDVHEGVDVYFDCKVEANPRAHKVTWTHDDVILQHNTELGVIVKNKSLVLQSLNKNQTGNYKCIATNVKGDGESNTVHLMVKAIKRTQDELNEMLKRSCQLYANEEAYENFIRVINTMIMSYMYENEELEDLFKSLEGTQHADEIRQTCRKTLKFQSGIQKYTKALRPCVKPQRWEHFDFVINITVSFNKYVCSNDGVRSYALHYEEAKHCLPEGGLELEDCNDVLDNFYMLIYELMERYSFLSTNDSYDQHYSLAAKCRKARELQACYKSKLQQFCTNFTTNYVDDLFNNIINPTCK